LTPAREQGPRGRGEARVVQVQPLPAVLPDRCAEGEPREEPQGHLQGLQHCVQQRRRR
jgi:hypothetical protein